jgi:hypothetical protein
LEDLLPESGFCWKKDCQDTIFRKIKKFQKIIFHQKTRGARRRRREEPQGGHTTRGAGPPLAASAYGVATLAHYCHCPFAYFIVPKNLSQGGLRDRHRRLCGAENTRERKALRQAEICRGIPSRRGEIVAIIIITPDFIGIIITIILIASTIISTITTPSRCNILS